MQQISPDISKKIQGRWLSTDCGREFVRMTRDKPSTKQARNNKRKKLSFRWGCPNVSLMGWCVVVVCLKLDGLVRVFCLYWFLCMLYGVPFCCDTYLWVTCFRFESAHELFTYRRNGHLGPRQAVIWMWDHEENFETNPFGLVWTHSICSMVQYGMMHRSAITTINKINAMPDGVFRVRKLYS
jgi:hypothetical protein